jgi:alkyl hydroperoxide reductase subunit AhpC
MHVLRETGNFKALARFLFPGVVRSLAANDLPVGRNPDEVLRQVQVCSLKSGMAF